MFYARLATAKQAGSGKKADGRETPAAALSKLVRLAKQTGIRVLCCKRKNEGPTAYVCTGSNCAVF